MRDPRLLPKEDNSTEATSCQVSYSEDDKQKKLASALARSFSLLFPS